MKRLILGAAVALVAATPAHAQVDGNTMRAHFINVGQGDATLLEFSCGVVMIDAGGESDRDTSALVDYLRGVFADRPELHDTIRAVFITHNHVDHTRGLDAVVDHFHVPRLIENGRRGGPYDPGDVALRRLATDPRRPSTWLDVNEYDVAQTEDGLTGPDIDPVECPGTNPAITILSADYDQNPGWPAAAYADKNNGSLVIRVDFGQASFLFTGDLETEAIATLLQNYANSTALDVDVVHVGHHGSYNGTTSALLAAIVRPEIAVISMSRCDDHGPRSGWTYGHPRKDAVDLLRAAITRRRTTRQVYVATAVKQFSETTMRDAIYATGWDGSITVTATAAGTYITRTEGGPVPACGP